MRKTKQYNIIPIGFTVTTSKLTLLFVAERFVEFVDVVVDVVVVVLIFAVIVVILSSISIV